MIIKTSNIADFLKRIIPLKILFLLVFAVLPGLELMAQPSTNEQLAIQYFQDKQFEKAALLFEDLYNAKPTPFLYDYYYNCLLELRDYKKAVKFVTKVIKKQPLNLGLNVDLGNIYLQENDGDKAKKQFDLAIKQMVEDKGQIIDLANSFLERHQDEYAMKTYEHGRKLMKNQ